MTVAVLLFLAMAQAPAGPVTLSGQVVDAEGRLAGGIDVWLSGIQRRTGGRTALSRAKSDDRGRFRIDVPPETDSRQAHFPLAIWAYAPKAGLAGQSFSRSALPAEGSLRLKLSGPASAIIRVVGPNGKPVSGARVTPAWVRVADGIPPSSSFSPPEALAELLADTTDTEGKAEIKGRRPEEIDSAWVDAAGFGRQVSELGTSGDGIRSITLRPAGRLVGRIEADDSRSTRGLKVIAMTQPLTTAGPQVSGDGHAITNADGRFEIAAIATGKLAVNVVPAEGSRQRPHLPTNVTIEAGKTTEVSIVLEGPPRLRKVNGRVVGSGGQAVAGAIVFQSGDSPLRTESVTDSDGRFQLNDVVARRTFLFARKPGYRFVGFQISPEAHDVALTIPKVDEPARASRKTLPPLLAREEELALARRVLDPYANRVLKQGGESEKVRTLEVLARVEPERVLELIDKKVFNNNFLNSMIGRQVASGLIDESLDEALAVLEGLENPGVKALGYIQASAKLAAENRAKALELLDRALLSARSAKEPDGIKLLLMGQVAERFLDLGQAARGTELLREGEALAKQLPKAGLVGYARGAFAEELVQVDLEAGLALTNDLAEGREFDRHHGNIAHELGGRDPAHAERVLAMLKNPSQRDVYAVRVVYRMAPLDLARARRLAESITDDCLRGFALGMMAVRLAETGKDSAREMLSTAFDVLERSAESGPPKPNSIYNNAPVAAALLPVAERIDPKLVDEFLWRSLAMRRPNPFETAPNGRAALIDVELAMMLARYDRGIARSLIEPFAERKGPPTQLFSNRSELHAAVAAIDAKWAVTLVEAMPDDPDLNLQQPKNSARLAVATVLGRRGDQRWRKLQHSYLYLWVPDVEDNNTDD